MEKTKSNRGVKTGTIRGTYNTTRNKNKQLWGYRFNESEYNQIKENFKKFQIKYDLTPTNAIKKIFLEIITLENTEENKKI